jgi:hypothetical protein
MLRRKLRVRRCYDEQNLIYPTFVMDPCQFLRNSSSIFSDEVW